MCLLALASVLFPATLAQAQNPPPGGRGGSNPGAMANVRRSEILSIEPSKVSPMPEGLLNSLKEEEILDLIAYLLSRGDREHASFR